MRAAILAIGLAVLPTGALGFCFEPTPPAAPSGGLLFQPTPPFCLNSFGAAPCDQWEIDAYVNQVNSYIQSLNRQVDAVDDFARAAARYANEFYDYARCEAEDAKAGLR
ncbi:MAG: hypothetical protein Kilf2KO_12380 [Rhodospirillales bacterium]